jgi:hypothetical protein
MILNSLIKKIDMNKIYYYFLNSIKYNGQESERWK